MSCCKLNELSNGDCARVVEITDLRVAERLQRIGLTEGCPVRTLYCAPPGDPTAYEIRGAVIALRREDTSQIIVRTNFQKGFGCENERNTHCSGREF